MKLLRLFLCLSVLMFEVVVQAREVKQLDKWNFFLVKYQRL